MKVVNPSLQKSSEENKGLYKEIKKRFKDVNIQL